MDKFENFHFFYRRMGANLNEKDYLFHSQDFYVHSHDYFEIYMFHRGDCKYLLNNQIIQLHENDIIVMNGSALHGPAPNHNVPYERSVINFSPEWIRAIINRLNVPEILTPFNQLENILLRDICPKKFEEIQGLLKKIHEKQLTMMSHTELTIERRMLEGVTTTLLIELLFIIYELTKTQVVPVPTGKNHKIMQVNEIMTWIDYHYHENLSLDQISEQLHISKYYMSRIFKSVTGITIMQYMMRRKLLRAKYLLDIYPEKSVLDVALESGFVSAAHFSRKFRKFYYVTPSEYRSRENKGDMSSMLRNYYEL